MSISELGEGHRAYTLTPTDRRGILVIAATLFMSWMVILFLIRVYTRMAINGPLGVDDLASGIGTVIGIAQVVVTLKAISYGFGASKTLLDSFQIWNLSKQAYIADILFLLGHGFAKASVAILFSRINSEKRFKGICFGILGFIGLWAFASVLAVSLRCDLSHPWVWDGECRDVLLRWKIITVFDILSEIILFSLSIYLIWDLQMKWSTKIVIASSFGSRLPTILLTVLRTTYLTHSLNIPDPSLDVLKPAIATQVLLHYSLMAATIPCLKPFVVAFNTGWGQGLISADGRSYYSKKSTGNSRGHYGHGHGHGKSGPGLASQGRSMSVPLSDVVLRGDQLQHQHSCVATATACAGYDGPMDNADSVHSADSQRMMIQQTQEWSVEHESVELRVLR